MHLILATTGIKHWRDFWVSLMQSQLFNWKMKDKETGKEIVKGVQGSLRPLELWQYVFPEENLEEVLAMLEINDKNTFPMQFHNSRQAIFLRKALKAEKIPPFKIIPKNRFMNLTGMSVMPIGIKRDERGEMKHEDGKTYIQEML